MKKYGYLCLCVKIFLNYCPLSHIKIHEKPLLLNECNHLDPYLYPMEDFLFMTSFSVPFILMWKRVPFCNLI